MALPPQNLLKIFEDFLPVDPTGSPFDDSLVDRLCASFGEATGWTLQLKDGSGSRTSEMLSSAPVSPGVGTSLGHNSLEITPARPNRLRRSVVCQLGASLGELLDELSSTRTALWKREAELATGVPVAIGQDDEHIAERLEATLQGGAEAIDCDAAALYLLDPATTQLKLRSAWGIPASRLADPPRSLAGAVADLEALTGHAVVLNDSQQGSEWKIPEPFESAVCVPVSSGDTPFGTLWVYSRLPRDFNSRQTNLTEIIAGRVAAELQLESVLSEAAQVDQARRQIDRAERWQLDQTPRAAPVLDDWEIAGWSDRADSLEGGFFDWTEPCDGELGAYVGNSQTQGIESALASTALRFALRACARYCKSPDHLLNSVSQTLWAGSAGNLAAELFCLRINAANGHLQYASGGNVGAIVVGPDGHRTLGEGEALLGVGPTTRYRGRDENLACGETLVIYTGSLSDWIGVDGECSAARAIQEALGCGDETSAETMIAILQRLQVENTGRSSKGIGGSILVIRRITGAC